MANTADTSKAGKIIEVTFTGTGADWNYSTDAGFDCMHIKSIIWHPSGASDVLVVNEGGVDGPSIVHWKAYADLVTNGSFTDDDDPPDDWTASNNATLTTEGSGQSGNCLMITCNGTNNPNAQQAISLASGRLHVFSFYVKKGTEATFRGWFSHGGDAFGATTDTEAVTGWTQYKTIFESIATTGIVVLQQRATAGAATTTYFDEVVLRELPLNKQISFGDKGVPLKPYIDISDCTFSDITTTKIIFILE